MKNLAKLDIRSYLGVLQVQLRKSWLLGNLLYSVLRMDYTRTNTHFYSGIYSFQVLLYYSQLNFLIYILLVYVIISKLRVDASRSRIGIRTNDFEHKKVVKVYRYPKTENLIIYAWPEVH